ncbi:MAG: GAF domain-containing protein [Sphingopyxis sp.]|uniref:sensor histidine kinase n=1 Tax=Sphingopyxis sp. TaxID=1908224 RepID=UPI002ABC9B44|nr:GAF domain-containing protein [Sphingopyxis sp.]MDZ3833592.1 GAF domain-containing protein [Sphingopyxis sp.]
MAERPGDQIETARSAAKEGVLADGGEDGAALREKWRLDTLREYHLLDTDPEQAFDRVTALVADLFDAPIALVSLVDDCRQWFKSAHGLDASETPRNISFCQHVVADERPVIVTDPLNDPRFADNPLVTGDPHIRFYAGVPLRAHNGAVLGTLCVIDREPREAPDAKAMQRLEDFAAIVMAEAELRRTAFERDEARRMLERALDFSSIAIWQFDPITDAIRWQGAAAELWGGDFAAALPTAEAVFGRIHPDDRAMVRAAVDEAVSSGAPYATEFRVQHPERGVRWLAGRADWDVRLNEAVLTGINVDITEQKSRQENANLLMRELHHRMRNLFATVGAIISLTRHSADGVDDYVERINSRLDALNRAQNVLLGANFMTGSMHALMREVEAAFPRIHWTGPDLLLPENALVAMALLFNELATNAVKHGALSTEHGRVEVSWTQEGGEEDDRRFRMTWTETGGAQVVGAPQRTSFGTLLMERSVRNNLGGTIERHWEPTGLVCEITLPARWREA